MIPKIIHYCWFGGNPLPPLAQKCIKSWKKYCPDYQIIEWNESNFDVNCNAYCAAMYEQKKWAFLTDYVRLKVVYENGGVYMDTDVELLKPLDDLLDNKAYMGFETTGKVNTGLGFGAEKGHPFILENMTYYENLNDFKKVETCPEITTRLLNEYGLKQDIQKNQVVYNVNICPVDYFCPIEFETNIKRKTRRTYSVHHFVASWHSKEQRKTVKKMQKRNRIDYYRLAPNRFMIRLLGVERYAKIKHFFGK